MIPFTVLGDKGAPITDLRKGEVRLLIDGKRVPSDFVHRIVGRGAGTRVGDRVDERVGNWVGR